MSKPLRIVIAYQLDTDRPTEYCNDIRLTLEKGEATDLNRIIQDSLDTILFGLFSDIVHPQIMADFVESEAYPSFPMETCTQKR